MGVIVVQDPQTLKPYRVKISGETPTEEELNRIRSFISEQRQVQPLADEQLDPAIDEGEDEKPGTALVRGLEVGLPTVSRLLGSSVEALGQGTGIKGIEDFGKSITDKSKEVQQEQSEDLLRRQELDSFGDYLSFYGEQIGQQLPQLGLTIGAGLATQSVVPIPLVGFAIGAFGAGYGLGVGSVRERMKDEGVEVDNKTAALYGLGIAALNLLSDKLLVTMKPLGLGFNPMVGSTFSRLAKGGAEGLIEVPTEIGQTILERKAAGLPLFNDEAVQEYIDVGISAGLVGPTFRGSTTVIAGDTQENIDKKKAAESKQQMLEDANREIEEARQQKEDLEENIKKGFDDQPPELLGLEEGSPATAGLNPYQDDLIRTGDDQNRIGGNIDVMDLDESTRRILFDARARESGDDKKIVRNPITDIKELKRLVEPRVYEGFVQDVVNRIKTIEVPQRYEESQYRAVIDAFKSNAIDITQSNRDSILDKVKDVLKRSKETDDGGIVTDTTADAIIDQMVLDGHLTTSSRKVKGDDVKYAFNEKTIDDKLTKQLSRQRQRINPLRKSYKKAEDARIEIQDKIYQLEEKGRTKERDLELLFLKDNLNKKDKEVQRIGRNIDRARARVKATQKELRDRNPPLPTEIKSSRDLRPSQQHANASMISAERLLDEQKHIEKFEYQQKRKNVVESLKGYLKELKLDDVDLVAENVVGSQGKDLSQKDFIAEGNFSNKDSRRAIALSMDIYQADLSETEYQRRLQGVLNHEVIHAVRSLGLFKKKEFDDLRKATRSRKYVFKDGKTLKERDYTYFDRAKNLYEGRNLKAEAIEEEAIAEMFRDAMDGKFKMVGKPKTLMEKFIEFFKSIFKAHNDNGFKSIDDLFENIKQGNIGSRTRGEGEYYDSTDSDDVIEVTRNKDGVKESLRRVSTTGQYIGAPSGVNTPQKLAALRRNMRALAKEGEQGRFWYERSSQALLDLTNNNKNVVDKLAQAIAITSGGKTPVQANFQFAIQAYNNWLQGKPIETGRFPKSMSPRIQKVFDGEDWDGRKTNTFYNNIMVNVDPTRTQGVTVDMHMMRAFGYKSPSGEDVLMPSPQQYEFVEREVKRISDELGWQPQQTQASIWVVQKARREKKPIEEMTYDYSDALRESYGQISWETKPSFDSGHMKEIFDAPMQEQSEYHFAMARALTDDDGTDIIAKELDLLTPGSFDAPGVFEGVVSPGTQTKSLMPKKYKGGIGEVDDATLEIVNMYSAIRGILLKQDGVGFHRPFWNKNITKGQQNGLDVDVGRKLTDDEILQLDDLVKEKTGLDFLSPVSTDTGVRLINFTDGDPEGIPNVRYQKLMKDVIDDFDIPDTVVAKPFAANLGYVGNNWKEFKNGEEYIQNTFRGRSDLQQRVRDIVTKLNPRVEAVEEDFSNKYGWTREDLNTEYRDPTAVEPEEAIGSIKEAKTPPIPKDTDTIFDIAPQEDVDKLSDAMSDFDDQVVTPSVKYSIKATKPQNPDLLREIPIDLMRVPEVYKRQLNERMLRYAYGYIRERNGDVLPITFKDGDHVELDDGREGGYGAWHIVSRGHDQEIREATNQEPEKIIYTMLRKMVEQEYGGAKDNSILIETDVGRSIRLTWQNNRPKKYPPIVLSLMYQDGKTSLGSYTVRTVYPVQETKQSIRRLSPTFTGSDNPFSPEGTIGQSVAHSNGITYTDSLRAIEKVIRGGTLGFVSAEKSRKYAEVFVRKFQDSMIPVGIMLDELRSKGLTIHDAIDPYLREINSHGIVGQKIEKNDKEKYQPMNKAIDGLNVSDSDIDDLISVSKAQSPVNTSFLDGQIQAGKNKNMAFAETYLYAKHAQERNAYILEKSKGEDDTGSGMTDGESQAILDWFRNNYDNIDTIQTIESQVRDIVADTNAVRQKSELSPVFEINVDPETGERNLVFPNYVPLKGALEDGDETSDIIVKGRAKPRQIKGVEDRRLTGRSRYATDIIANLIGQNMSAVKRAEQNEVGLATLRLVESGDPNVSDFAKIFEKTKVKKYVDTRTGTISRRFQTPQEIAQDDHIVIVKRKDPDNPDTQIEEVAIEFMDKRIARAIRGDGIVSPQNGMSVVKAAARINRFLSSVNTSYNPTFVFTNLIRDFTTANINIAQHDIPNISREMRRNSASAFRGIKKAVFNNAPESDPDAKYYYEFVKAGGRNMLNTVTTLADQQSDIQKTLGRISKNPVAKSFVKLRDFVENANIVAENTMRVATFKTLREKGFSPARAAQAARNVTVNFAKTGEWGRFINSFYLFYNASIQGTFAALQAAAKSKKVRAMWGGLVVIGLLQDQIMATLSEEDEDGILVYDKIGDYTLEHNIMFPDFLGITDRSAISIPLPYGFNAAFNMGRVLSRWSRGAYTAGRAVNSIEGTLYEIINPFGGTEHMATFVLPTVADPIANIAFNVDYAGRPLFKEQSQFGIQKPESQLGWNSTSEPAKNIARIFNEISGGTEGVSGYADVNPALIDFWFEYITGGLGTFVLNVGNLATGAVTGDPESLLMGGFTEENIRRTPILRKFIQSVSEREDVGEFIQKRDRVLTAFNELKRTTKMGDREGYKKTQERFKDELRIAGLINGYNNARNRIMRLRSRVEKDPNLTEEQKRKRIERYNEDIQAIIAKANMAMRNIKVPFLREVLN